MARTITALRTLQIADLRECFRIEAEVSAGSITSVAAHCQIRLRDDGNAIRARSPGYTTIRREWAQLGTGVRSLFTSLKNSVNRADCFRIQIEVADDGSVVVTGHCTGDPTQVVLTLTGPQSTGISSLIAFIDGEAE